MELVQEYIHEPEQFSTERLVLKPVDKTFKKDVHKILANAKVRETICLPTLDSEEKFNPWWQENLEWLQKGKAARWCAYLKENQEFTALITLKEISTTGLRAEIGYSLLPRFWGKGLASEAVSAVLEYGFQKINLHSIFAMILTHNEPSIKLIKKMGFEQEGYFKDYHFSCDKFWDVLQFGKLNKK